MNLSTPEGRLELYIAAFRLFEKGYSHPQIIDVLSAYETDISLLTPIVDKAMAEEWDKIYNQAIKLFALKWRQDEILSELSKKDQDTEVVKILVADLYNRRFELIDDLNAR